MEIRGLGYNKKLNTTTVMNERLLHKWGSKYILWMIVSSRLLVGWTAGGALALYYGYLTIKFTPDVLIHWIGMGMVVCAWDLFIRQILQTMRTTVPGGGMFGKGAVGDIYGDMMDNVLAEVMSKRSVFGLTDLLYRQLIRESDVRRNTVVPGVKNSVKKSDKNDDI